MFRTVKALKLELHRIIPVKAIHWLTIVIIHWFEVNNILSIYKLGIDIGLRYPISSVEKDLDCTAHYDKQHNNCENTPKFIFSGLKTQNVTPSGSMKRLIVAIRRYMEVNKNHT